MRKKPWLVRFLIPFTTRNGRSIVLRLALIGLSLGLGAAVAVLAYDYGQHLMDVENDSTREQIASLTRQIEQMTRAAAVADSLRSIERSTQQQLTEQITTLEKENARLKEELSFFERLLPASPKTGSVVIRRLAVEAVPPNHLRYRLLIWAGNSEDKSGFSGQAQLVLTILRNGRKSIITLPHPDSPEEENFRVSFRHYQRLEGIISIPEDATVKSVQARILDGRQIRAQHSIKI